MSQVGEVKEATDIVSVVGERVTLSRSGRNFRGLCPFHSEKSPSFFVAPELQVYRCFGCGEKGDVFTFLEKYDGLTFSESLKLLADRAGITLHSYTPTPEDSKRETVLEILELAQQYYHYLLTKHHLGESAREYLKQRQTNSESIKLFRLGYALPSWDGLLKYMVNRKKYFVQDLDLAGLVILRSTAQKGSTRLSDYYDRFRGRLIFPLTDHRGRVVGFSGRVLEKEAKEAKYINTPETIVYHKSTLLFGYSQHYRELREAKQVVVVEGEFDVISSSQAHVRNVVAIKGSALTKEHVDLLVRTVETLILSLDADSAGVEATKRAIQLCSQAGLRVRVLSTKELDGKDPDDFARSDPKGWRQHLKKSVSAYQFLIDVAFQKFDESSGEGKRDIMVELAPVLNSIPHAVEKAHYVTQLANRLGVSESIILQDLTKSVQKKQIVNHTRSTDSKETDPLSTAQKLEQFVLFLLFQLPEKDFFTALNQLPEYLFSYLPYIRIRQLLEKQESAFSIKAFSAGLPGELSQAFSNVYLLQQREEPVTLKEFQMSLVRLQQNYYKERTAQLTQEIKKLENKTELTQQEEAALSTLLFEVVKLKSHNI